MFRKMASIICLMLSVEAKYGSTHKYENKKMTFSCFSRVLLIGMVAMLLNGCAGDSTPTPPPVSEGASPAGPHSGTANMGVIVGGSVSVHKFINGTIGAQIGQTLTSNNNGQFDLATIAAADSGPVILISSDPTGTAMYFNEAEGIMKPFPANKVLHAVVSQLTGSPVAITPLTEVAAQLAMQLVKTQGLTDVQAINKANQETSQAFLSGIDPLYTIPVDVRFASAGASNNAAVYANVLAGIAYVAQLSGIDPIDQAGLYAKNLKDNNAQILQSDLSALILAMASFNQSPPANVFVPRIITNVAPVAFGQTLIIDEDVSSNVVVHGGDLNQLPVMFTIETQPRFGKVIGTPPNLTYTPDKNFNGQDSFYFVANNGFLSSKPTLVNIIVNPVADVPQAFDGVFLTPENQAGSGVLQASDADGDLLTYTIVTPPAKGLISTINQVTGEFSYAPDSNVFGRDSFTFQVKDATGASNTATMSISIHNLNNQPSATAQLITLDEDGSRNILLAGTDADGDPLAYVLSSLPLHGAIDGVLPNLTYTPDTDYNGQDSFRFYVTDGALNSQEAVVSLHVVSINDSPVAFNRVLSLEQGKSIDFTLSGKDPEQDILSYAIHSQPTDGVLAGALSGALAGMGTLQYTPNADFSGQDSITFTIDDGNGGTGQGTVTIEVLSFSQSNIDSDGDGLRDSDEISYGTNPTMVDTDGDGHSDFVEIVTHAFDKNVNNYRFNPLIADTPEINVKLLSVPDIRINYIETSGASSTVGTTRSTTSSEAITLSQEESASVAMATSVAYGSEVSTTDTTGGSVSVSVSSSFFGPKFSGSATATYEHSKTSTRSYNREHSTTRESMNTWSTEQSNENSQTLEESRSFEKNNRISSGDGEISLAVSIENTGHQTFTLKNLFMSVSNLDVYNPQMLMPVANLAFDGAGGTFPLTTLSPNQSTDSLVFRATGINKAKIQRILEQSNGLSIRPTLYTMLDQDGVPFNFNTTAIRTKTAIVTVDFNDNVNRPFINKMVAVKGSPNQQLSILDALQSILQLPVSVNDSLGNPAGVITSIDGFQNIAPPVNPNDPTAEWIILHAKRQGNDLLETTIYVTPAEKDRWLARNPDVTNLVSNYDPSTIYLGGGDILAATYLQDDDSDGLDNRIEAMLGSDPSIRDSDLDGLEDGVEVKDGWQVAFTDVNGGNLYGSVFSSPVLADTDGDGVSDGDEKGNSIDPFMRTNPNSPDTDGDGFDDSLDDRTNTYDDLRLTNIKSSVIYTDSAGNSLNSPYPVEITYDLPKILTTTPLPNLQSYEVYVLRQKNVNGDGIFSDPATELKNHFPYLLNDTIPCKSGGSCVWEIVHITNGFDAVGGLTSETHVSVSFTDTATINKFDSATNTPAEVFEYIFYVKVNGYYTRQAGTQQVSVVDEILEFHMIDADFSNVRLIASAGSPNAPLSGLVAVTQFDCHIINQCQQSKYYFDSEFTDGVRFRLDDLSTGSFYKHINYAKHQLRFGDGQLNIRWNIIVNGQGLNTDADQWHVISNSGGNNYFNPGSPWNIPSATIDMGGSTGKLFAFGNNSLTDRSGPNGNPVFSIQVPAVEGCHTVMLYFDEWDHTRQELSVVAWPAVYAGYSLVANVDMINLCRDPDGIWSATAVDPKSFEEERNNSQGYSESYDLTTFPQNSFVTRKGNLSPIKVESRTMRWNDGVTGFYQPAGVVQRVPINADLNVRYDIYVK